MEELKQLIISCFKKAVEQHLFEMDTTTRRHEIICEFVEECAMNGHGIQAEIIEKNDKFYGVEFIHESGYKGTVSLDVVINLYKNEDNGKEKRS